VSTSIEQDTPVTAAPRRLDTSTLAITAVGAFASGLVVVAVLGLGAGSDFKAHVALTKAGLGGAPFPGDFLFYWLEALLAGFQPVQLRLYAALAFLLAVAGGAKMYLTVRFAKTEYARTLNERLPVAGAVLAAFCFVVYALAIDTRYPAFVPPNVWHNSTTTLLMPLAFGLYWVSLRYLREPSNRLLWWMVLLLALNVAAKPSFTLCWLVVFPIAVLIRDRAIRALVGPALVCLAGALMLGAQYAYIYLWGRGDPSETASAVRVEPFHVWSHYAHNLAVSVVMSYAFPIVAALLGGRAVRGSLAVQYAAGLALVGLAWFATLTETGAREFHGNFMWQAIVTNYLLYIAVMSAVLPWLKTSRFGWRQLFTLVLFAAQVLCGAWFVYLWLTNNLFS
jgi:hypothetical protein